jgi:hypothetical protein
MTSRKSRAFCFGKETHPPSRVLSLPTNCEWTRRGRVSQCLNHPALCGWHLEVLNSLPGDAARVPDCRNPKKVEPGP